MRLNPSLVTTAFASAALLSSTAALAHAKLVAASPAANATVEKPVKIELRFNEKLTGQFSSVELAMTDMPGMKMNKPMRVGGITTALGADGKSLIAALKAPLGAGTYKLAWHAVTADTHRVNGSYTFRVK